MYRSIAFVAAVLATSAAFAAGPQPYERTVKVDVDDVKPRPVSDVDITYGGFVKLDALASVYSDGKVPSGEGLRDYDNPNLIPVTARSSENSTSSFGMHAKETRLFFKIDARVADAKLGGYVEMDFLSNPGFGTDPVTNAYNPALRRAFVTYNNWLFGQDWSTFQGTVATPDGLDFIRAPSEGTVFVRQPQVRYTYPAFLLGGDWQVSLENPETTVRPKAGATPVTAPFATGDGQLPDLVSRYLWKPSFGEIDGAVLVRQLRADLSPTGGDAPNNVVSGTAGGYGASVAGKIYSVGKDDVRFMVTGGNGIGRYLALAAAPDAVVDRNNGLKTVPEYAGYVAYRHPWNERWRSSLMASTLQIKNDKTLMGTGVTKSIVSGRFNVLYSPVEKLTFGAEYTHATRKLENGNDGQLDRVQFSAMYAY